jgi:hypothetical protein
VIEASDTFARAAMNKTVNVGRAQHDDGGSRAGYVVNQDHVTLG